MFMFDSRILRVVGEISRVEGQTTFHPQGRGSNIEGEMFMFDSRILRVVGEISRVEGQILRVKC